MKGDPNRAHLIRDEDFNVDTSPLPEKLRKEFKDFLIRSAEFPGYALYAEMKRRAKNPDAVAPAWCLSSMRSHERSEFVISVICRKTMSRGCFVSSGTAGPVPLSGVDRRSDPLRRTRDDDNVRRRAAGSCNVSRLWSEKGHHFEASHRDILSFAPYSKCRTSGAM